MMEAHPNAERVPLHTFTRFPELPMELRLAIWKLALPNGDADDGNRTICLSITTERDDTSIKVAFHAPALPNNFIPVVDEPYRCVEVENNGKDMLDVGMLRACGESRAVYLGRFTHNLPAPNGGVIYFEEQTTIQVNHFEFTPRSALRCASDEIDVATYKRLSVPVFNTIRKLAVSVPRFAHSNHRGYLRLYRGLESLNIYHGNISRFSEPLRQASSLALYNRDIDTELMDDEDRVRERFEYFHDNEVCPKITVFASRAADMKKAAEKLALDIINRRGGPGQDGYLTRPV